MWQCVFLSHFVAAHQPQSPQCSNSNDAAAASLWRCIWNLNLGQWTLLDPNHLRSSSWNPLRLTCSNWLVYFPFKILEHGFGWQALRMTSLMWATMARRFFSIENVPGRCWRGVCCLKNGNPHTIRQLLFSNCCYFPKSCMFDPPSRNASGNFENNTPKTPNINTNSKKLCNWATAITELWWAIGLGYITLKMRHKVVLDCLSHAHVKAATALAHGTRAHSVASNQGAGSLHACAGPPMQAQAAEWLQTQCPSQTAHLTASTVPRSSHEKTTASMEMAAPCNPKPAV